MPYLRYCLVALLLLPVLAGALPAVPYIQVSGQGSVSIAPDMAQVSVSVEDSSQDMAAARAVVERRAVQVINAAKKLGVVSADIKAANIAIWPEYRWQDNTQVYVGQHVSRHIQITLRNLSQYADLVSALVKAGVANVSSTTMERSDMPLVRQQALAKAVEDAHQRALAITKAAGVALGSVYSITENSGYNPRPVLMAAAVKTARSGTADYEPGDIDVIANVSVVYLLKQAR